MIYPIHKFFLISFRGVAGRAMGCAIDHHPHQVKIPHDACGPPKGCSSYCNGYRPFPFINHYS